MIASLTFLRPVPHYTNNTIAQTTQMSTQRATKYGIARRIRFLRGDSTQEEFSRRVGITRSALANYESNRSTPNDFVLDQIASRCDMPATFFDDADLTPNGDWNTASFLGRVIEGRPDWTDDELSFVRLLRLVPADVVARIADAAGSSGASPW